jgi:hypothetical protein
LRIGKPILNRRRGTAKLPVTVPAAGTLSLRGRGVASRAPVTVAAARTVKLSVKPKARTARLLARTGKAKVKAIVSYARKGGGAETASATFTLKLRRHR